MSSIGCTINGQEVRFTVHYENGFTISKENGGSSSILYRYPFERLKMSADDGIRNLYLDFGGPEGELVRVSENHVYSNRYFLSFSLCFTFCIEKCGHIIHLESGNCSLVFKMYWVWVWGLCVCVCFFPPLQEIVPF